MRRCLAFLVMLLFCAPGCGSNSVNKSQYDRLRLGMTPREAELTDPQQRIFLELCWECMERGGYVPDAHEGPVGVFGGMHNATYFQRQLNNFCYLYNGSTQYCDSISQATIQSAYNADAAKHGAQGATATHAPAAMKLMSTSA